ncbi:hypothetical protein M9458_045684, partial [Cirrhinus mrigala]
DEEIESLTVFEGGNLTISIHIEKWDENPQILLIRRKGFSKELIAQIICHNGACAHFIEIRWRECDAEPDERQLQSNRALRGPQTEQQMARKQDLQRYCVS